MRIFAQVIVAGVLLVGMACVDPLPIVHSACPCPAGYCCDLTSHRCVLGSACPTAGDGGARDDGDAGDGAAGEAAADGPEDGGADGTVDRVGPATDGEAAPRDAAGFTLTDARFEAPQVYRPYWPTALALMAAPKAPAAAGEPVCMPGGWCWSTPTPHGGTLAVWALAADDVWVVGSRGLARHFDGNAWTTTPTPTTNELRNVWGSAANAVWAAHDGGLLRWNGSAWSAVDTGGRPSGPLAGRGPSDLWMASSPTATAHFDGKTWTDVLDFGTRDLFATADGTLYGAIDVVEPDGSISNLLQIPPDGGKAKRFSLGGSFAPAGVWASGPTDVWLSRFDSLMRFDGTKWRTALEVFPGAGTPRLGRIRGSDASHVWVSTWGESMLRWNGATFERWLSGASFVDSISARAADDVWVAGRAGTLSHFDGTAWQRQGAGPQLSSIHVMAAVGSEEVWALGSDLGGQRIIRSRAGGAWEEVPIAFPQTELFAVWGSAPDDVWVSGLRGSPTSSPVLAHWDGAGWSDVDLPAGANYTVLWGTARDDVWAGGRDLRHWDGMAWREVKVPGVDVITGWVALAGTSKTDVWAEVQQTKAGMEKIMHWDGAAWRDRTPHKDGRRELGARAPDDVFAWSSNALLHFDGQAWTTLYEGQDLRRVWLAGGQLWRLSTSAGLSTWNGTGWTTPADVPAYDCRAMAATARDFWLGCNNDDGAGAGVLHLPR